MRIKMIGKNNASIEGLPRVTIEFSDVGLPGIHEKVLGMLIDRTNANDKLEAKNEKSCVSVPRIHGWAG